MTEYYRCTHTSTMHVKGGLKTHLRVLYVLQNLIHFSQNCSSSFLVNQDVVLVSLMRKVIFSAACANDLIKRPVAFGRKLSIPKPNECNC